MRRSPFLDRAARRRHKLRNLLQSALLLGARFVVIPGLDHTDTVARKPVMGNPIDRVLLWKSLLYLALSERPT